MTEPERASCALDLRVKRVSSWGSEGRAQERTTCRSSPVDWRLSVSRVVYPEVL